MYPVTLRHQSPDSDTPLNHAFRMPGVSVSVSLAEVLEVRGAPLREVEIWAVLCQAAESLQDELIAGM